jgi:hypothetical protein
VEGFEVHRLRSVRVTMEYSERVVAQRAAGVLGASTSVFQALPLTGESAGEGGYSKKSAETRYPWVACANAISQVVRGGIPSQMGVILVGRAIEVRSVA